MIAMQGIRQSVERVGAEWIQALLEKDYQRLAGFCQPEVRSRLMTPKRFDTFENVSDLTQKVETWFKECTSFQEEQTRVYRIGEKLAISYRFSVVKEGQPCTIEQQLYCTLRDGLIDQLNLLCSGFQPVPKMDEASIGQAASQTPLDLRPIPQPALQADAFLKFETSGGQASTCAILTPSIKHKLGEMSSGQVLEVQVDDPSAREDIEAWCRLSGNTLIKMDQGAGQELHFYLKKK